MIRTSLPPETAAALDALPVPRYPTASGEMRMNYNRHGAAVSDRVSVLLDSPGPPAEWGGPETPPLCVLIVPIGPVPAPGHQLEAVDLESFLAREMARLEETHRHALREARAAQYRLDAPGCHRADGPDTDCASVFGVTAEMADGSARAEYRPPNGWCWWCWNRYEIERLRAALESARDREAM